MNVGWADLPINSFTPVRNYASHYRFSRNCQQLDKVLWTPPIANVIQIGQVQITPLSKVRLSLGRLSGNSRSLDKVSLASRLPNFISIGQNPRSATFWEANFLTGANRGIVPDNLRLVATYRLWMTTSFLRCEHQNMPHTQLRSSSFAPLSLSLPVRRNNTVHI